MNQKGCGKKWSWPNLRYLPGGTEENNKKPVRIASMWAEI
jgi:hypothetical protein